MSSSEIVLALTKPETEWVRGRALQKVSPTYWHGLAQRRLATLLGAWAERYACSRVATEWRFRVTPPGERTRPLVPDVAYVSFERLSREAPDDEVGVPRLSPNLAVEILSPDDRMVDVLDNVETFLVSGSDVVLVVNPTTRDATAYDANGDRYIPEGGSFSHERLPNLVIAMSEIFDKR
jgi:Uma2 family endonuclease